MLIETIDRVQDDIFTNPIMCGHIDFKDITQSILNDYAITPIYEIYEPIRRNTAATITLALMKAYHIDKDATVLILPTDHQITKKNLFLIDIKKQL
jgi:mannose-1-phosphate guanylyltransferase